MSVPDAAARRDAFDNVLDAERDLRQFVYEVNDNELLGIDRLNEFHELLRIYRVAVEGHTRLTVVK